MSSIVPMMPSPNMFSSLPCVVLYLYVVLPLSVFVPIAAPQDSFPIVKTALARFLRSHPTASETT